MILSVLRKNRRPECEATPPRAPLCQPLDEGSALADEQALAWTLRPRNVEASVDVGDASRHPGVQKPAQLRSSLKQAADASVRPKPDLRQIVGASFLRRPNS